MKLNGSDQKGLDKADLIGLTAQIVSAYVGKNEVKAGELPALIKRIHQSLDELGQENEKAETLKPAVSIKKSITDDYLVCLEDGEKFRSLRRHLRSKYDMSPEEYREKWGLPHDYPMVAPSYAKQRSELAKKMGLGQAKKS
ncbi:MAG: MucR family transcriptional regulator [Pseudomonadota bacterium]